MNGSVYRVDESFGFCVQVPDDKVGISGSRCGACGEKTAYSVQICKNCGLPFIGPFGFPQYEEWTKMLSFEKNDFILTVFNDAPTRGRVTRAGMLFFPLTIEELVIVEKKFTGENSERFEDHYGVHPQDLRGILLL